MIGLMFFLGHIILFVVIIFCTRFIKSGIKRCISIILVFFIIHFALFFENFLEIFVTPIYCKLHNNEPITVYTTPQEWRETSTKDIIINKISDNESVIAPYNYNFNYNDRMSFNNEKYELFAVSMIDPRYALYSSENKREIFNKIEMVYYDVKKDVLIIGKSRYLVYYKSFLAPHNYIKECENSVFDDLDKALSNYQ